MEFIRNQFGIFAILIVGLIAMESFVNSTVCNPNVACTLNNNGLSVADPINCTRFYLCILDSDNGYYYYSSPDPQLCPDGTQFNQETANCETSTEECTNVCCDCDEFIPDCSGKVPGRYPAICQNYYYECKEDDPATYVIPCGDGFYFDEIVNDCTIGSCGPENIRYCSQTTTTSTTTSTTTPATIPTTTTAGIYNPCQQTFSCPYDGNFKNCNYCHITYWHCHLGISTLLQCDQGYLFNTNDNFPFCLLDSNCPYP